MSSAITFYFKEIFPTVADFETFLTDYDVADISIAQNQVFAQYIYKVLFRKYHNSNVQYDTPDDFKCDLANIIEDGFDQWKRQLDLAKKTQALTDKELLELSTSLSNSANNPNTKMDDPTEYLEYVGAQVVSFANNGKLNGYLNAIRTLPTKLIGKILMDCGRLFKTFIPNQIFIY